MAARTLPMYEVQHARRPQAAARQLLMYDVRRTMYDWKVRARCAEFGEVRGEELFEFAVFLVGDWLEPLVGGVLAVNFHSDVGEP